LKKLDADKLNQYYAFKEKNSQYIAEIQQKEQIINELTDKEKALREVCRFDIFIILSSSKIY